MASKPATPPETLGRYILSTKIVRPGGQAIVTQAYDPVESKMVAIKRMRFGPEDERAKEGFRREVQMLQDLRHPNIVEMIEVDRDNDGNWYLVLEWLPDNLDTVIERDGAGTWDDFLRRFGRPILDAVIYGQKKQIAHRDIKPKNILVSTDGVPKLADYGIAKLLDNAGSWAPVKGPTFRFDYTKGYTPAEADTAGTILSRDCYAFAAVALSCVTGRNFDREDDPHIALQEAALPNNIRAILERCLHRDASKRPPLASALLSEIERAEEETRRETAAVPLCHLSLSSLVQSRICSRMELQERKDAERFVLEVLGEVAGLMPGDVPAGQDKADVDLVGATWRFRCRFSGRHKEVLELANVLEVDASLATSLRERCLTRPMQFTFERPRDPETSGQQLGLLLAEAAEVQRQLAEERKAKSSQRIFRIWRGYLRDRADFEAKRTSAIKYVDRNVLEDRVVLTTEIAQTEDLVGQERVISIPSGGRLTGTVAAVAFNKILLNVTFGDASRLPRRGELAINTLAAQRALDRQSAALDAVLYDRAESERLKGIIIDPRTAEPVEKVEDVVPTSDDFDEEKKEILAKALGVQDILAIEGPPGTGKTKLIAEIVVQWLKRHPGHRILLSSQTHIALDNVLERITETGLPLEMIRIGRSDETRISDLGQKLLLEKRVEAWIKEVRKAAEADMQRWATEKNVDREAVALGMKVERLLQLLAVQKGLREAISRQEADRVSVEKAGTDTAGGPADQGEVEEETTQIDSEIGISKQALKQAVAQEKDLRSEMEKMGEYAAYLSQSKDPDELGEWAKHFLADTPMITACRDRLKLLEDWLLRVGRSSDFNTAMLSSAQIIAGTCVGIAGVRGMEEVGYDLCVVDEASKATATEILIPLSRSKRSIVVGDPEQLPPFFEQLSDELLDEFEVGEVKATLLDRLLDEHAGLPAGCRAGLKNQYRMIKAIGDLVSACFYQKKLKSPVTSHGLKLSMAFPKPVTWYSTQNLDSRFEERDGLTYTNPTEVAQIRQILLRLEFVAKGQNERISVAVLSGYTGQVKLLSEMVQRGIAEWPSLDVACSSVDAFQGRQADICIYSVVRSNDQKSLGFLRERPRLNVALSRGKSGLLIVGDNYFCRNARGQNPFKSVIDHIDNNESTCTVEELQ
ncbi:protein kinase [Bradyrhizobium sp. U87765 SZCCT0131]|uniref:AAA domain-containing protein n=1 Tax=unclassified Bradyrhizobium TaxID=2631580 RepID=UPI001BABAD16|nr:MULTISPECIES: AAA domain-containing protein [unclassified Bradyrhizobium]MBR1220928.1 protein kinase [Bradyrhizobium sp. U87765 SZCCT0131]MBR1260252.1 protein kinase [Bradyrhizobium sp. U87765 SZCCT0134]MBR1307499.1 protein kinase [Bradyrhizobium sp. U87765 SZCCT0110]MBR1321453.1 protein kinase [Bradyrhizobium sp. U87765 SZCCT0109]MBR1349766.1 protein kinase [Bradyrhizobium sp. U87765 SZCCT0048]